MGFFKRVKKRYLKDYLIYSVRRLERTMDDSKLWDISPVVLESLINLLVINMDAVMDDIEIEKLNSTYVSSNFSDVREFIFFCGEFMTQTTPFKLGEVSNRPKVDSSIRESLQVRQVSVFRFMGGSSKDGLKESLIMLGESMRELDSFTATAPSARKRIIMDMLKEVILPAFVSVEKIYEVINDEGKIN